MRNMFFILSILSVAFGAILLAFGNNIGIVGIFGGLVGGIYLDKTENQ